MEMEYDKSENEDVKKIDENGEIEVQVSTVGEIVGSDKEGNPVPQSITEESLSKIAENLNSENKEVLVDVDHQSVREGLDRDTKAVGWLSRFWTNAKGLFAKLKLTPMGREMVEGREYRKLSPVFGLGEDGTPVSLESAAFTNTPAMTEIEPILNQKPNKSEDDEYEDDENDEKSDNETAGNGGDDSVQNTDENGDEEVKKDSESESDESEKDTWDNPEELVSMWKQNCDALQKTVSELKTQLEDVQNECSKLKDENDSLVKKMKDEEERAKNDAHKNASKKETIKESALNAIPTKSSQVDVLVEKPWGTLKGDDLLKWARKNNY